MKSVIRFAAVFAAFAFAALCSSSCEQTTDGGEGDGLPLAAGNITGPTEVVEGKSIELTTGTIHGATTYKWSRDGVEVQNTGSKILTVTAGGTYRVAGVNTVGEGVASPGHVVVRRAAPPADAGAITGPTELVEGESITLEIAEITGAATYQWYKDGEKGQNTDSRTLTVTEIGTYKVAGVNAEGDEGKASPDHVVTLATPPPTP
jgi:hypothetical protein